MKIVVLVKQVPNTTEVKLDPKTGNLIREGIESIINPDDRHALEAAAHLKETAKGKVTVLSMGPPQAIDAVSEAMGMGADEGILLTDRAFAGADTWATSSTLGKAIETIGAFDLILCGRQAIDGDTAQIGPQVADYLNVPQVTYVIGIEEIKEKSIVVKRRLEDGFERVECDLPALLTVIGEMNTPRYPRVDRLIDACREKAPHQNLECGRHRSSNQGRRSQRIPDARDQDFCPQASEADGDDAGGCKDRGESVDRQAEGKEADIKKARGIRRTAQG